MIAVIPSYNPDHHLGEVIRQLHEATDYKLIIVDDGSSEEAKKYFDCLQEEDILLIHEKNRGKGAAMKTALSYIIEHYSSEEDGIVFIDGDGQHKTNDIMKAVNAFHEEGSEKIILGSRSFEKDIPWKSKLGNTLTHFFFMLITGKKINDTQTGLRVFPISLASQLLEIHGDRYEYEMNVLITMVKSKKEMKEIPIETVYENNENKTTHFRPIIDSVRIYSVIFRFLASSCISAVADYGIFILLLLLAGQPKEGVYVIFSNIFARVISATMNYIINRNFVFYSKKSKLKTALQYVALAIFILAFNSGMLYVFTHFLHVPPVITKVIVETISFSISFLVQQRDIF